LKTVKKNSKQKQINMQSPQSSQSSQSQSPQLSVPRVTLPGQHQLFETTVLRVVDGDTIDVRVRLPFQISCEKRCRLFGIDAFESRTRDMQEKQKGLLAKDRLASILASARKVFCQFLETGKFGREIVNVFVQGPAEPPVHTASTRLVFVNAVLVEEGHAVAKHYD
jgi:endonuclease YncB( thermonuclease family)